MRHALLGLGLAASAAVPMLLPPWPVGPAVPTAPAPSPAAVEAPHLRIDIEAFDAAGHRVPFDGVVTVVDATTTGMLSVHSDATTSWVELPLQTLAVPMVAVR